MANEKIQEMELKNDKISLNLTKTELELKKVATENLKLTSLVGNIKTLISKHKENSQG